MHKWLSISLRCLFLASLLHGEDRGEPAYDKDWGLCNGDLSVRGFSKTCPVHAPGLLALLCREGSWIGEGKSDFGVLSSGQGRCGRADAGCLAAAGALGVHRGIYTWLGALCPGRGLRRCSHDKGTKLAAPRGVKSPFPFGTHLRWL